MPETELLLPIPTPPRAVIVLPEPSATAFAAPALALLPTAVALSSALHYIQRLLNGFTLCSSIITIC